MNNNTEINNYLANHKQLLKQYSQNSNQKVDTERKCLVQTYSASLQSLSNESTLELLKVNLNKLSDNATNEKLVNIAPSQKNLEWHSNLRSVDKSFLQALPCSQKDFNCKKLNNLSEDTYQMICSNFIKKSESNDHKARASVEGFSATPRISLNNSENTNSVKEASSFKTAFEELKEQNNKKIGTQNQGGTGGQKRRLGMRGNVRSKFVSPMLSNNDSEENLPRSNSNESDKVVDERLKNIEPRMVELIQSEIMDCGAPVHWDDIAGLKFAKTAIQEAVVWPLLRPDIFTGLRRPPKGILLFGPPGTGKTLIGKCVASQSKSTFFSISASSLTSKWIGDGEKMVRALFAVARCHQPAVIFIDEIDSLLSQRSETEHESSRRIKTEFLVQLDGATTDNEERILVIGATNRPQELDEAARRRFVKRLYIPLPEFEARLQLVTRLMQPERKHLTDENYKEIAQLSDGYSGADMKNLCSEASLGPIRSIDMSKMQSIQAAEVRPVDMNDFNKALSRVKASVSSRDLDQYVVWNGTYGSGA